MDCPKCGTYNPEDRTTCWRCDAVLPRPKPVKRRDQQQSARTWLYVAIAAFFVVTLLQMCGFKLPFGPQSSQPGGQLPTRPAVAWQMPSNWQA